MENVLKKIINKKKERIKIYKKEFSENKLFEDIKNLNNFIDFKDKIKKRNSEQQISIITEIKIDPKKIGVKFYNPDNLKGQDANYNANKIIDIFSGNKNEFSEAVCLNSAAALIVCNKFDKFEEAYEFSKKHLESDKALTHLKKIQTFQNGKRTKKDY